MISPSPTHPFVHTHAHKHTHRCWDRRIPWSRLCVNADTQTHTRTHTPHLHLPTHTHTHPHTHTQVVGEESPSEQTVYLKCHAGVDTQLFPLECVSDHPITKREYRRWALERIEYVWVWVWVCFFVCLGLGVRGNGWVGVQLGE